MSPARRRRVQRLPVLWLTAVWVLLWGEVSFANVLGGLAVAVAVSVVFPLPAFTGGIRLRPVAVGALLLRFVVDLLRASVGVAWLALRPGAPPTSSLVVVPLATRDQLVQTIVAEMVSLVPGSLAVDLDPDAPTLALHSLGASDPESVERAREDVLALQARVLRAVGSRAGGPSPRGETGC